MNGRSRPGTCGRCGAFCAGPPARPRPPWDNWARSTTFDVAPASAPACASTSMAATRSLPAANISAVRSITRSRALTSAPCCTSSRSASAFPAAAASISAVVPFLSAALASAPAASNEPMTAVCPFSAASSSGMVPSIRVAAFRFAPAPRSMSASSTSPRMAAQWRAVMPSPCAALTSAPSCSSAFTAAALPACAASATRVSACAPCTAIDNARTIIPSSLGTTRTLRGSVQIERPCTVAKAIHVIHTKHVQHAQHRIRHRRPVWRVDVQVAFQLARRVTGKKQRAPFVIVNVGVPHRRTIYDQAVIEQRAVAVGCRLQLLEEVRDQAHVILVDGVELQNAVFPFLVVRRGMEARVDAALRVHATRTVAAHLERKHARDLRCERDRLQIEHQPDVLLEIVRYASGRFGHFADFATAIVRLDFLDPPLDLPYVVEILVEARAIGRPKRLPDAVHLRRDPVEHAAIGGPLRRTLLGGRAKPEQLIEGRARIADHRQRFGGTRPTDGIGVDARVTVGAAAGLIYVLDTKLHRRNGRVLSQAPRVDLIHRWTDEDVRPLRLLGMRLREVDRARAEVIAADLGQRKRLRHSHVGVAENREVLAIRIERVHRGRREIEAAAGRHG